jgi:hypothetical protein
MRSFAAAVVASLLAAPGCAESEAESPELACYKAAERQTNLGDDQKRLLCRSAGSEAPATCYVESDSRLDFSKHEGIALCRCARSPAPVDCAARAERDTDQSKQQIIGMCSARSAGRLADDCTPR